MKDVPIKYSRQEEDLNSASVDGSSMASDLVRRMRKQQASSALSIDQNDMLKAATPFATENVHKEEDRTRESETWARLNHVYPTLFGRSNQENNIPAIDLECRDSPPPDVIVVQDGSFAGSEISSIERTYTSFINQNDYPSEQYKQRTAIKDQSRVVEKDPPQPSDEARESLIQDDTESLVSETSVRQKYKLKSFRLFPGLVDAMARRKNQIAAARDRRRILEEKRAGKSKKKSLLNRQSKTGVDLLPDDQIPVQSKQQSSPIRHVTPREVEVSDQNDDMKSLALDNPDQIPATSELFTREQVENFVDANATSLAHSELASFEALYHAFLSTLQVGEDEREQVQAQLYTESGDGVAFNPTVGPFDFDEGGGDANSHGINTTEPENVVQVDSVQSGLGQISQRSVDTEPNLSCGSSIQENPVDQSSQVAATVPQAFEDGLPDDMMVFSSSVNEQDDDISEKYCTSYPNVDEKKPADIGRVIKGRGREGKRFEAVGMKSRAKYQTISLVPSNTGSADSWEPRGRQDNVDTKPDESQLFQKMSLGSALVENKDNLVEEEDFPNEDKDVQGVGGGVPDDDGDAMVENYYRYAESRKDESLRVIRDKDIPVAQIARDEELGVNSRSLMEFEETKQQSLDGNCVKAEGLNMEAVESDDLLDEVSLSFSNTKVIPYNLGSTIKVMSLQEPLNDEDTGKVGFTVPKPVALHNQWEKESQSIGTTGKSMLSKKENRKKKILSGTFLLDNEMAIKSQVSGGKSLPSSMNPSVQNKKNLGFSRFRKKVESKGTGKTEPGSVVPLDKVLSTPSLPQTRDVWQNTKPSISSGQYDTEKAKSLQRSVTCPHGVIGGGDLLRPIVQRKPSCVTTGENETQEQVTSYGGTEIDEHREARQTTSEDDSTNNRQSLLDTETFDSYQTDRFEEEDDDVDVDDEDSVLLDGDCKSYSNFLDWVGRWILPLGGSKVCVPVDEDRHVADYAPHLKAVVAVGVETINSYGSNVASPISYEDLSKIEAGMCNDVRLLTRGLDLIAKLDNKK